MIVSRLILTLLLGALSCLAAEPVKKPAPREGRKTISYAPQPWGTSSSRAASGDKAPRS